MEERQRPGDGAETDGLAVPSAPRNISVLRQYAVTACTRLGRGDAADTVELLVSEVATNAVLHAYGPEVRVRVLAPGRRVRVEVFDGSPVLPVQRHAPAGAEGGRGIALVEALAVRWGIDARTTGKTFWFEVD